MNSELSGNSSERKVRGNPAHNQDKGLVPGTRQYVLKSLQLTALLTFLLSVSPGILKGKTQFGLCRSYALLQKNVVTKYFRGSHSGCYGQFYLMEYDAL
jgi:hypothetical protein